MSNDREWRLFQIDAGMNEPEPHSTDPEQWAAWCDRKAHAAKALHDEAEATGDAEGAATAQHLHDIAIQSARRLRRGDHG